MQTAQQSPAGIGPKSLIRRILGVIDSEARSAAPFPESREDRVEWSRIVPFVALHTACLLVFVVGWSWFAVSVCVLLYFVRMFGITAFYHRYFSHRAFETSRSMQFVFALVGASSGQRGPLWWAAHHRKHHKHSDTSRDAHSPVESSFLWSHVGWFTTRRNYRTDHSQVRDLSSYPELRWLDRFDVVPLLALGVLLFGLGEVLAATAPGLQTGGLQLVVWGFCISTVLLFHGTSTINSLGHLMGRQRFATGDESRNSLVLALLTLGEGWHNNHHFYPVAARQGFRWWEIDVCYYALRVLSWLGVIWGLKPVPAHVQAGRRVPLSRNEG